MVLIYEGADGVVYILVVEVLIRPAEDRPDRPLG
jgi:hypothetical protein